ncbi:MAG: 4Fe-4S ferredoxin [Candidatus Lokiarchaeota archaeon]|nr:4Fe-4S ferredoxin [Candidatus Lokiarchaeota archaeon]
MKHLLETSVSEKRFRKKKLLLYGSCIEENYPEILKQFLKKEDIEPIHICLETFHMDHVGYKLANIIKYSKIEFMTILTVDGSPHCLGLHMIAQDIIRNFSPNLIVEHWVIEKGKLFQISKEAIKTARHLHMVKQLLEEK